MARWSIEFNNNDIPVGAQTNDSSIWAESQTNDLLLREIIAINYSLLLLFLLGSNYKNKICIRSGPQILLVIMMFYFVIDLQMQRTHNLRLLYLILNFIALYV